MKEVVETTIYSIRKYTPQDIDVWNEFVGKSANGTFLFKRSYMDYHKDRFEDHSYLIWDEGSLVALFVAGSARTTTDKSVVVAHPGLTYGGLVHKSGLKYYKFEKIYNLILMQLKHDGFTKLIVKPVSRVFSSEYSEAHEFYFYKYGFSIISQEINSVIDLTKALSLTRARKKNLKKADASGLRIEQSVNFHDFWAIMASSLMKTHGVRPVHTAEELLLLHQSNPNNIILFTASVGDKIVGGTLLFMDESKGFVHSQYTHANEEGREIRAIDAMVVTAAMYAQKKGIRKFSFGISTVNSEINYGLLSQKEDFGSVIELMHIYEKQL
ncbi:GNAT family N-acetyltransferase [Hymenobacter oligotrophus]|uniref:GNAT family N-acetyltransferase n=1 Tax=Hymenobacter oligotrophus TaxID=2319843 RepID=A0A3B7QVS0_9BACT|nr:GNAT family N-acetyltransferase [Hymenobacter oligotrophus]AYA37198.1 GNAT family N-acetyltransferase [Hymenobacter oligotrophus]